MNRKAPMNRKALVTIALLSSLATPLVVQAMTPAPRPPAQAPVPAPASVVKAVAIEPPTAEPSCARKVKIVYAGYGEGAGRPCAAQPAAH
jgi:hypothetical protein